MLKHLTNYNVVLPRQLTIYHDQINRENVIYLKLPEQFKLENSE